MKNSTSIIEKRLEDQKKSLFLVLISPQPDVGVWGEKCSFKANGREIFTLN